jgi:hypothetical protein
VGLFDLSSKLCYMTGRRPIKLIEEKKGVSLLYKIVESVVVQIRALRSYFHVGPNTFLEKAGMSNKLLVTFTYSSLPVPCTSVKTTRLCVSPFNSTALCIQS